MTTLDHVVASPTAAPGPSPLTSAWWMLRISGDILGSMDALMEEYGDVVELRLGPQRVVFLRGAEAAKHVLVTHQDIYPKAKQFDLFAPALGQGLVTSSGETWRRSRRMVQPLFAKRHLGIYADHMASAASDAVDTWDREWATKHRVDLDDEMLAIGLDTVCRALFSLDISEHAETFGRVFAGALHEIGEMSRAPGVLIGQDVPKMGIIGAARLATPRHWHRFTRLAAEGRAIVEEIVDDRIRHGHGDRNDLLTLLMESVDPESGDRLPRQQVIDEAITFIGAGHETTPCSATGCRPPRTPTGCPC